MKVYSVTVHGREIEVTRNGDGTFSMPEDVAVFKGYNVSLKPAHEPIVLARKPIIGTVAANVMEFGTGALNVDGCRVAGTPRTTHADGNHRGDQSQTVAYSLPENDDAVPGASGRWPPNFCISHHPDCRQVGVKRVRGTGVAVNRNRGDVKDSVCGFTSGHSGADETYRNPDGTETVPDMDCHPDCPVKALGEMSGETKSHDGQRRKQGMSGVGSRQKMRDLGVRPYRTGEGPKFETTGPNDHGTAARFFPCFRYQAKSSTCERNLGMTLDKEAGNRVGRNSHPT